VKSKTARSGRADFLLRVREGLVADPFQRGGEVERARLFSLLSEPLKRSFV
jgi:hypothetical protein